MVSSVSAPPPSVSVFAVTHTGAVHEFLLLHFRMGHLIYYNSMLRALYAGAWSGFRHSLEHIRLEQLPQTAILADAHLQVGWHHSECLPSPCFWLPCLYSYQQATGNPRGQGRGDALHRMFSRWTLSSSVSIPGSPYLTTDDVTFVETDVQIPDYSGNMELELAGLHDITPQDREIVDAYSERDNEVDWEQRALTHIDTEPQDAVSTSSVTLNDPHQLDQQHSFSPSKVAITDGDDAATDPESVFRLSSLMFWTMLFGHSFLLPPSSTSYAPCYDDAGGDPESFAALAGLLISLPKHFIHHHTIMSTSYLPPPVWLHHITRLHLPLILHPILPHTLILLVDHPSTLIHYLQ